LRDGERETIVAIPPVVGIVVVRVEPRTIVIRVRTEQVQVAIEIAQDIIRATTP
jgi:hypothetical protein